MNRDKLLEKAVEKDMVEKPYLCSVCGIKARQAGYPVCISCNEIDYSDDPAFSNEFDEYLIDMEEEFL